METIGSFLPRETGIFEFLKALPRFAAQRGVTFSTPSETIKKLKPVDALAIPYPLSGTDEARDVSAWKGNTMQREALNKLYGIAERVDMCKDRGIQRDWSRLQNSDHFYYMSTKQRADGASHSLFSPYDSPFSAFTNYMNVLADFMVRVREQFPEEIENEELNSLLLTINNQASEIEELKKEVKNLRTTLANDEDIKVDNLVPVEAADVEAPKPVKKTAKKPAARKTAKKK